VEEKCMIAFSRVSLLWKDDVKRAQCISYGISGDITINSRRWCKFSYVIVTFAQQCRKPLLLLFTGQVHCFGLYWDILQSD